MTFKTSILFIVIGYSFTSCSKISDKLLIAERIMETKPDSALLILESMHPDEYRSEPDRTLYGSLLAKAYDINDKLLSNDNYLKYFSSH
ncbi:MAG TPA: hypothetical protein VK152_13820 [Paludibacter sp.]|nr:hypothetical protein [Paludibacter sp.]